MYCKRQLHKEKGWFTVTVLLVIAHKIAAGYDKTVCTLPKSAIPPPLPILSTSFSSVVEVKNLIENSTMFTHEFYDSNKKMSSLTFNIAITTVKMLLEYKHGQYIVIRANTDSTVVKYRCEVHQFTSPITFYDGKPWLSSVKNLLDVLARASPVYKGTAVKRDMPVDYWSCCLYDPTRNMTMSADIYYRSTAWIQSYSPMSSPVQIEIHGTMHSIQGSVKKFHFVADYVDFIPFPKFPDDTFLTQPGVFCPGRSHVSGSTHPYIRNTFALMFEIVDTNEKQISYEKIWYDAPKNISRVDTKDASGSDEDPVSTIYDFNSGIKYSIDKFQETCDSELLVMGDRMVSLEVKKVKMKSALELLSLDTEYIQYVGQAPVRGVKCDIWVGIFYNREKDRNITVQWYFTADQFIYGVGTTLEQNILFRMDKWEGGSSAPVIYNVLHFDPSLDDWRIFDIGRCYKTQNKTHFVAQFEVISKEHSHLEISLDYWRNKLQEEIAKRAQIETIRFSKTSLEYNGNRSFYFAATLLDKQIKTSKSSPGSTQYSLGAALSFLRGSIDGHWTVILPTLIGDPVQLQGKSFRILKDRDQFKMTGPQTTDAKPHVSTTYAIPPIIFPKKTTVETPTMKMRPTTMTSQISTHLPAKTAISKTEKAAHSTKVHSAKVTGSPTQCVCPSRSSLKPVTVKVIFKTDCPAHSTASHLKSSTTVSVKTNRLRNTARSRITTESSQYSLNQPPRTISPGEVTGVSIATFVVGVFLGCVVMIIYNKYQKRNSFSLYRGMEMK